MEEILKKYIQEIAIEKFLESEIGEKIQNALILFDKIQTKWSAISEKIDNEGIDSMKIMTIMTFAILKKLSGGKSISDFNKSNWKEIAINIEKYAVFIDDKEYVVGVFDMYKRAIESSVLSIRAFASEEKADAIADLGEELSIKRQELEDGIITEVEYIENCLWICLEATIKILSVSAYRFMKDDYAELSQAFALYAFEYGRFMLYSKEQELLNEYLESQKQLDESLKFKYERFIKELEKEATQFMDFVDNAFDPNFRISFINSVSLAKAAGVDEKEILTSVEDIDSFFM